MNKKVTKTVLKSHTEPTVKDAFMCQEYKLLLEDQKKPNVIKNLY